LEATDFEEVPQTDFRDYDDYDLEEKAEILAMGNLLHDPTKRSEIMDKEFNRRMYVNEPDLPEWFAEDERKHNKPLLPVTKEMVAQYKLELKEINSRTTKKVAEAKARKKKKYLEKLQKARAKAKSIVANSEYNDREKVKEIQKLYKGQLKKIKPEKVYVIGRKVVSSKLPRGKNVRVKLVDPRLKKDKRGRKAADRRKEMRTKRRHR